jgi:prepilin-type N-terminal cleavage/methylation domain-containing protein
VRTPAGPGRPRPDGGFSLIEVVVATGVLGVLAAATGLFFANGMRSTADLQRRQLATSIGAQAMEMVRGVSSHPDSMGCTPLLSGRTAAAVNHQWSQAPSGVDLSTTDKAWAAPSCSATVAVPLSGLTTPVTDDGTTPAVVHSGTGYVVRTFIGSCSLPKAGGVCAKAASVAGDHTSMYRVIVAVTWERSSCPGGTCLYTVTSLLDPTADPLFNLRSTTVPVATNDLVCTAPNAPVLVSVLGNDSGPLGADPVTIVTPPAHGTLTDQISTGTGKFTPANGYLGTDAFTYFLTSSSGVQSGVATVTLKIGTC